MGVKRVHAFSRGISPKVNVITRSEFDLTYFEAEVQYFCHKATGTPSSEIGENESAYLTDNVAEVKDKQKYFRNS